MLTKSFFLFCLASSCVHRIEIWSIGCKYMQCDTSRPSPYSSPTYCPPFSYTTCSLNSESEVAQSCPTLCDPMNCNLSGSSIHGIFQARVLEWIAIWQRPKEESRAMGQKEALSLNDHIKGAQLGMPARNFDKSKKLTFTANLLWFCIYLLQDLMSAPK